jgi:hypothetical protein
MRALTLAVVASLMCAGGAWATTRVVGSATQQPSSLVNGSAICPQGEHPSGGGFGLDPAFDPNSGNAVQALVQGSFPAANDGWKSNSFAIAGGSASTFYTFALCRSYSITVRTNAVPIAAATHQEVRAKCPQNRHVIGGGYSVEPRYDPTTATGGNVAVDTSKRRNEHVWTVGATRDFGDSASVVAHVLCERDFRGQVVQRKASVGAEDVGQYTAVARCPRFRRVVSGGFKAEPLGTPGNAMATGLYPWVSRNAPLPGKRGWLVTLHNDVGPLPGATLTAFAYCK